MNEFPNLFSRKLLAAWAVLALSLTGTLIGWQYAVRLTEARAQAQLDAAADAIASEIRRRMTAYEQVLHAGAALFAASDKVSRAEWRDFVTHLKIEEHFPGIQVSGSARRIAPAELGAHIRAVRAEGFPGYTVRPEGARETYTAIVYLEPFGGRNLRAFGFDMFSEPVRREAMLRASDTANAALSGKVTLVQETERGVQAGFLLYVPVYTKVSPRSTAAERRAALAGWAYAPFRMNDFMRAFVGASASIVDLEVFDGEKADAAAPLFDLDSTHRYAMPAPAPWQRQDVLELAGHRWTVQFRPQPAFAAGLDATPRLILAGGILISLLLFAIAAGLATTRERAYALAGRLNRELQQSHDSLETKVAERTRELRNALHRIEAQNRRMAETDRMKTEFLNTLSHELKTPLNAIIGFSELLAEGIPRPLPPDQRQHAQDILDAGRDLLKLIDGILQYTAGEAGRLALHPRPIELAPFLAERLRGFEGAAGHKHIALALDVAEDLPRLVADPNHLRTLLGNLLDNAVKFTPEGGSVTLRAMNASPSPQPPPIKGEGAFLPSPLAPQGYFLRGAGEGPGERAKHR